MKGKRNLLIGASLGVVMGWALGYLRLPLVEQRDSFWVGVSFSLACIFFLIALIYAWNRKNILISVLGIQKKNHNRRKPSPMRGLILALLIVFSGLFAAYFLHRQNNHFEVLAANHADQIQKKNELIESLRGSQQGALLSNVLVVVEEELKGSEEGVLSDATVSRIAALSHSCQPYPFPEGDSISNQKLSPERGQLLVSLALMPIDSGSYAKIKQSTTFAGADLRGANLSGFDLNGVDLENANLKDADLRGSQLREANLRRASLWGAKLDSVDLSSADLVRANLSWVEMNGARLKEANFDGADLSNAQLRGVDSRQATFQWATLDNALLMNGDFDSANFFGGHLVKTNFSSGNLSRTDLRKAVWDEANLSQADLSEATIREKDWLETLDKWHMSGTERFPAQYAVVEDTSNRYKYADWCLRKTGN